MYAVFCVQLSNGHDRHKSKGDPVYCVCRSKDSLESAKKSVTHLLGLEPGEKVDFECLWEFKGDGKAYALVVENNEPVDWVVYVREITPNDEVIDFRYYYSASTWTQYHLKCTRQKV